MNKDHHHISEDFLTELLKSCITSKSILEIAIKHLQYHYIISEAHKKVFQRIVQVYELDSTLPTIGSLSQDFSKDENVLKLLQKIRVANVSNQKDLLLQTFEKFLINVKFIDLYQKIGRLNNEGSQDKAIKALEQEAPVIANFTIKDQYYATVFKSFNERNEVRQMNAMNQTASTKVPFGIHCLDADTRGGADKGTSVLVMARSGGGKSSFLRWVGVNAARLGMRVVHFQFEGSERECLDTYDAAWTGITLEDMELGFISPDKQKAIEKANRDILATGGELFVKAAEGFDEMSMNECDEILKDIEKIHGSVDLVIFDYLELVTVKGKYYNSEAGERKRREDVANKITSIAVSHNVVALTAIQANDVKPEFYNNPEWVMTRSQISEFKGALKPFSQFYTLNSTDDEYENNIMRIHNDKMRKGKRGRTHKICTSFDNARLYSSKKTLSLFWDEKNQQPIKSTSTLKKNETKR